MELGGLSEFRYVPEWKGNRQQPENNRLSLTIRRLRALDVLAVGTDEDTYTWRDKALKRHLDGKHGDDIREIPIELLRILRIVSTHTSEFRNFLFNGKELTSAAEIFGIRLPMPAGDDQSENLLLEVNKVLGETSNMTAAELEDFATPFTGNPTERSVNANGAVEEGDPIAADIPQESVAT